MDIIKLGYEFMKVGDLNDFYTFYFGYVMPNGIYYNGGLI